MCEESDAQRHLEETSSEWDMGLSKGDFREGLINGMNKYSISYQKEITLVKEIVQ